LKSLITRGTSWVSNRLGAEKFTICLPLDLTWGFSSLSVLDTGACPLGCKPAPENYTCSMIMLWEFFKELLCNLKGDQTFTDLDATHITLLSWENANCLQREFPCSYKRLTLMHDAKFILEISNILQLETLPACQIWQKNMPPLAWTASTIGFHASTCSFLQIPGVFSYLATHTETSSCLEITQLVDCAKNETKHYALLIVAGSQKGYARLSCIWNSSSFSNQETPFGCSLFIIQCGMRLSNAIEGSLPCQWCKNYPKQ
jgi:hypothetical protein